MPCERCGASTRRDASPCRGCASEPPRRIRVAVGLMAVYWGAFVLYTYGTMEATPSSPVTGPMLFFGASSPGMLIGLWKLAGRAWGWVQLWYALFLVLGLLGIFAVSLFPVTDVVWLLPVPAFVWFIYSQHDLYLADLD